MAIVGTALTLLTTLDSKAAEIAAELFPKCVDAAKGGGKITDKHLCEKINGNAILRSACARRKIEYIHASFFASAVKFLLVCLRAFVAAILIPINIIILPLTNYVLDQEMEKLRPLPSVSAANKGEKTAAAYVSDKRIIGEVTERSGSEPDSSCGPNNGIGSHYYNALAHRITIAECTANSDLPTALAFAAHECGHGEQRIFLLVRSALLIICSISALVGLAILTVSPIVGTIMLIVGGVALLTAPIALAMCEINASQRGIVNLIAYDYITTRKDAEEASFALQLAATTYLAAIVSSFAGIFY
ncbi:MAG: zinc metallopeptidase [Puniceicoccales bacterium]|jgi:hypothetical protein|nr:zinc metallopeptidase [Puniceicoccales bacterium]